MYEMHPKVFLVYHMIFDFNNFILIWLSITLAVKAPLKFDKSPRSRLHAEKEKVESRCHTWVARGMPHHFFMNGFDIFPDVRIQNV